MFGSMKKAMVVAAVLGIGAVAPSVASADQWKVGGSAYAGSGHVAGTLTLTLLANGATTTCNVTAATSLTNPSGVAAGSISSFLLGVPAGGTCVTSLPNCSVTATATASPTSPWAISTSATNVTISGINFTNTYSGVGCALAGASVTATGAITGAAGTPSANSITFTSASGLTTGFGPATVSGTVAANTAASGGSPISLG